MPGFRWRCSAITNVDVSSFSCFYALRSPRNGAFGRDEIELCRYLAPHTSKPLLKSSNALPIQNLR